MKNSTKMWLCLLGIIIFGILAEIFIDSIWISFIIGGILLFGIGFGWYACKAKEDEKNN